MITPRITRVTLACTLAFVMLASVSFVSHAAADKKPTVQPNIVFIIVDDLGRQDISLYGSKLYETPNIDELAEEGMRFDNAYAAHPRCVPSRTAIMSGRYPVRYGVPGFEDREASEHTLPLEAITFAEHLQDAGYHTGYIGKWHLGKDEGGRPDHQGFEESILAGHAGAPGSYFYPWSKLKKKQIGWKPRPFPAGAGEPNEYLTDRLTQEAVGFIERNAAEPFMLVLAYYAVHTPFEAKPESIAKYEDKIAQLDIPPGGKRWDKDVKLDKNAQVKTVQNNPVYAAMVASVDDGLGRIVKSLEELGLDDNTVILLTSDHGGLSSRGKVFQRQLATSNLPYRHGKGWLYEGGIRVPMIVKWPQQVEPGTVSDVQVTGTDHYPTILAMAGQALSPSDHIDGVSYVGALGGHATERGPMFWHSPKGRPQSTGDTNSSAIIDGDWKLIEWHVEGTVELYNLRADPGETKDLSASQDEKRAELQQKLASWKQETGARLEP